MATVRSSPGGRKPSFAKVVASASNEKASIASNTPPNSAHLAVSSMPVIVNGASRYMGHATGLPFPKSSRLDEHSTLTSVDDLVAGVGATLLEDRTPSLVVNGSAHLLPNKLRVSVGDSSPGESHKADSTSDLCTKPPSLDGKSITSGTTFALDEKESLRPDDSASVKAAAVDDDDAFSIRGSLLASSRIGSDIAVRRIQAEENVDRRIAQHNAGGQPDVISQGQDGQPPPSDPSVTTDALNIIYRQAPDEKLLEAMQSPKDRIFLLRLEKDVIDFVRDSKEPYMDLPPCNSFCRMLTHKLADYYHMTHSYEPNIGAVRIFRTPFCRVPQSLASIAEANSASNTPPPVIIPRRIMRREDSGDKAISSYGASKPASEDGSDAKDKASQPKERMTREEREEAYNRARERIFGNSEKIGEVTQENDNGVSRASSVSGKDKSSLGRKGRNERRRRDSGSFESRAHYAAYYPHPQQSTWGPQPQYVQIAGSSFVGQQQQPFSNSAAAVYATPSHGYGPPMAVPGFPPAYPNAAPYPPLNQPRYPGSVHGTVPAGAYGTAAPPVSSSSQSWPAAAFNSPPSQYPLRTHGPSPGPLPGLMPAPTNVPYLYGQLPANANPNDPKSQHPIPGSYNRHAFNPKTQSFVPNSGLSPMQGHAPSYVSSGSHHGSPQIGSPHLAYAPLPYQIPVATSAQNHPQPFSGGYSMARQGSSNSMMPFHHAHTIQHPAPHMTSSHPSMPAQHIAPCHPPQSLNKSPGSQAQLVPGQPFSHLPPHFGNPATLPQKPA